MYDLSAILADTTAYGFTFAVEEVSEGEGNDRQVIGEGPLLVITKPLTFEDKFPGRIVAMLDGSSARVIGQRVVRDAWKAYRKPKEGEARPPKPTADALKPRVLNAILGVKGRVAATIEVRVYALPDGSTTKDLEQFRQAWGLPKDLTAVLDETAAQDQ